jgi:hypothetical protein
VIGPLLDSAEARGAPVVAVSEYGVAAVNHPVHVNRMLGADGLPHVDTQHGMEHLDPWTSQAVAVADHQVAHVHVADSADLPVVRKMCERLEGIESPRRAPGSAITTGTTAPVPQTSPGWSRSTASPATTRPSCSSTRPRPQPPSTGQPWR